MKNRNILICPLEWGLGHAARMIPLARKLEEQGATVFVGAGEEHLSLFRREMPGITYISFPGFRPGYSKLFPSWLVMFCKIPALIFHIIREHSELKRIIRENSISIVISDNRFGLWNKEVTTVYVTHMLRVPFPKPFRFAEVIGIMAHREIIRKYDLCFIPDLPGELNVSGRLSHQLKLPANARFIGLLSRFSGISHAGTGSFSYRHITVILSGPEPQRGILKQKLGSLLMAQELPVIFLEGRPGDGSEMTQTDNLIYYNHLDSRLMSELLTGSDCIISRSGYTTIMELISLGCTALVIPTPGQTEQEYLASYLKTKGWFSSISQKQIGTTVLVSSEASFDGKEMMRQSKKLLDEAIKELLEYPE
jgi:spore coat polysaccharide biosynthesis predicted glycosyltransferase SpsG